MNERSNASTAIHSNNDDDDDYDDNDNGKQEKLPSKCTNWFSKWFFFFTSYFISLPISVSVLSPWQKECGRDGESEKRWCKHTKISIHVSREIFLCRSTRSRFGTQKTVSNFQLKCAVSLRMKQPHTHTDTKENEEKNRESWIEWNWFAMVFTFVFLHVISLVISFSHPFLLLSLLFLKLKINSVLCNINKIIEHSWRLNM